MPARFAQADPEPVAAHSDKLLQILIELGAPHGPHK
jgi:hypothetical protein